MHTPCYARLALTMMEFNYMHTPCYARLGSDYDVIPVTACPSADTAGQKRSSHRRHKESDIHSNYKIQYSARQVFAALQPAIWCPSYQFYNSSFILSLGGGYW